MMAEFTPPISDHDIESAWQEARKANDLFNDIALLEDARAELDTVSPAAKDFVSYGEIDEKITKLRDSFDEACTLASFVMLAANSPFESRNSAQTLDQESPSVEAPATPEADNNQKNALFKAFDTVVGTARKSSSHLKLISDTEFEYNEHDTTPIAEQEASFKKDKDEAYRSELLSASYAIALSLRNVSDMPARHSHHKLIGEYLEQFKDNKEDFIQARARVVATLYALYRMEALQTGGHSTHYEHVEARAGVNNEWLLGAVNTTYAQALTAAIGPIKPETLPSSRLFQYIKHTYRTDALLERTEEDDGWVISPRRYLQPINYPLTRNHFTDHGQTFTVPDGDPYRKVRVGEGADSVEVDYIGETEIPFSCERQGDEIAILAQQEAGDYRPRSTTGAIDPQGDFPRIFSSGTSQ